MECFQENYNETSDAINLINLNWFKIMLFIEKANSLTKLVYKSKYIHLSKHCPKLLLIFSSQRTVC